jgi:Cu(I)/Ag(I) efflux system periplasmic protein CusF
MKAWMKWTLSVAALAGATAVGTAALAQDMTAGEVTKLDKAAGRITLKHGGIKQLDMPPMAMAFRLRDGVAVGDRVRFSAERIDGQYVVTSLGKAP